VEVVFTGADEVDGGASWAWRGRVRLSRAGADSGNIRMLSGMGVLLIEVGRSIATGKPGRGFVAAGVGLFNSQSDIEREIPAGEENFSPFFR